MAKRVAVITGANSGIGYATVKGLCQEFDGDVLLTALTTDEAEKAVAQLKSEGHEAKGMQLDQTDQASIAALKSYLKTNYGGVDALVCNAGTSYKAEAQRLGKMNDTKVVHEAAKRVFDVNVFGTVAVLKALNDLFRAHCRIVVLSSKGAGYAMRNANDELKQMFLDPDTKTPEILKALNNYIEDVKSGDHESKGWPAEVTYSYPLSKLAVAKIATHIQKEMDNAGRVNIMINACCPGFVATQLTNFTGCPPEQGAQTPIYLATLPGDAKEPRGKFVADKQSVALEEMLAAPERPCRP